MDKLFLWISSSMIIGILSSYYSHFNIGIISFSILILSIYSFYSIKREKLNNIKIIILFFLFVGIFLEMFFSQSLLIRYIDKTKDYSGVVREISQEDLNRRKYIIEVDRVDDKKIPKERVLVNILGGEELEIGWRIDFYGKVNLPNRNTNPKLFNYRKYLLSKNIHTNANIKDFNIEHIEKTNSSINKFKTNIPDNVGNIYGKYLSDKNSSLIKSMILGDSSYIEEGDLNKYRDLGISHILAISGLHIGILSGFLLFLFSRLGIKRELNILMVLTLLWIYAFIVGFPSSILRANIMLSVLLISQLIHEPYDIINSVFLSMTILIVLNPYNIFSIGFIMTYTATLSIIILTPKIKMLFYPYENNIISTLSAIIGVQIGLTPILAYFFNKIPLLSIIGNLFIIPILSISIILGFLIILMEIIFPSINFIFAYFLNLILNVQFSLVDILSRFSLKELKVASPDIITILLYYLFILVLFKIIKIDRLDKKISKVIFVYLLIFIFANSIIMELDEKVELHFIDVGQGDSILLRSSNSDYLIDTGGSLFGDFDIGKNITLPYLEKIGVKNLKAVFITHFHEDHYKGLYSLLDEINIDYIASGYYPKENPIIEKIHKKDIPFLLINSGDGLNLSKDLKMDIIWPGKEDYYSENNMSLVCTLNYKGQKVLLTGDMEREVEKKLLNNVDKDIDIIKVPHHGSNTSSTEGFLSMVKPKIGVVSVGRNNIYNHPSLEVLERYNDIRTKIYRTDEMGRIKLILYKNKILIKSFFEKNGNIDLYLICYLIYYIISYVLTMIYFRLERRIDFEL